MAHRQRQRWRGDLTLNTTALVHEAYLKLVDQTGLEARSRTHFLGVAAKAIRHILCNSSLCWIRCAPNGASTSSSKE